MFSKVFSALNVGNMPVEVQAMRIQGRGCKAYGVAIDPCGHFVLHPGEQMDLRMHYIPDFSTSLLHLSLSVHTADQVICACALKGNGTGIGTGNCNVCVGTLCTDSFSGTGTGTGTRTGVVAFDHGHAHWRWHCRAIGCGMGAGDHIGTSNTTVFLQLDATCVDVACIGYKWG